jgi:hypothetical protein
MFEICHIISWTYRVNFHDEPGLWHSLCVYSIINLLEVTAERQCQYWALLGMCISTVRKDGTSKDHTSTKIYDTVNVMMRKNLSWRAPRNYSELSVLLFWFAILGLDYRP